MSKTNLNDEWPGRPRCFKKEYSAKSDFCQKVCRHARDCSNPAFTKESGIQPQMAGKLAAPRNLTI